MPELEDDDKKGKKGDKKGGGAKEDPKKGKKDDRKGSKGPKDKGEKPGKDEKGKGKPPQGERPAPEREKRSPPGGVPLAEDKTEKSEKSDKSRRSEKSEKSEGSEAAPAKKGAMKPSDKGKKGIQKIPPPSEAILKAIADEGPVYAERYYNDEYEDDEEVRNYVEVEMFEHRLSNTGFGSPRGRGRGRGGPAISARGGRTGSPPPLRHESRSVHDEHYYEQCDPAAQQQHCYGRERADQQYQRQQPMRRSVTQVDTYYDESSGSHHFEGSYYEIGDDAAQGGRPALQRVQAVPRPSSPLSQERIIAESSSVAMAMNAGRAGPVPMQQQRSRSRCQLPPAGAPLGQRSRPSSRQASRQASETPIIIPVTAIIVAADNADTPPPAARRSPRGQRSRDWIEP